MTVPQTPLEPFLEAIGQSGTPEQRRELQDIYIRYEQARQQMEEHLSRMPVLQQMDPELRAQLMARIHPQAAEPTQAHFGNMDPRMRDFTIGYALAQLLSGGNVGDIAQTALTPVAFRQQELDRKHAVDVQNQEVDAKRAAIEMQEEKDRLERIYRDAVSTWQAKGKLTESELDRMAAAYFAMKRKAEDSGDPERVRMAELVKTGTTEERRNALKWQLERGYISEHEFNAQWPLTWTPYKD